MAGLGNQNRQEWNNSFISALLPSLMMVPLTGQTHLEAGEGRSGYVVPRGQPPGTGQGRELVEGACKWRLSTASPASGFHIPQVQSQG